MKFKVMYLHFNQLKNILNLMEIFTYRPQFSMAAQDLLDLEWQNCLSKDINNHNVQFLIEKMVEDGLVIHTEDGARLTLRGMWFYHSINTTSEFILLKEAHKLLE